MAVTADTLGRVILWDIAAVTAIRMWKGYRDAQCAWLMLPEVHPLRPARDVRLIRRASSSAATSVTAMDHDGSSAFTSPPSVPATAAAASGRSLTAEASAAAAPARDISPAMRGSPEPKARKRKVLDASPVNAKPAGRKEALHLVVYAPKRGVVELWPLRQGKRLRSLSCGGSCRLLSADPPMSAEPGLQQQCAWARDCLLLDSVSGSVTALASSFIKQSGLEPMVYVHHA